MTYLERTRHLLTRGGSRAGPYAAGDLVERIIGFAMLPVYARELGVAEFGTFAVLQAVTGLAGSILLLGQVAAIQRHWFNAPPGRSPGAMVRAAWVVVRLTSLIGVLCLVGASAVFGARIGGLSQPLTLAAAALIVVNVSLYEPGLAVLRVTDQGRRFATTVIVRASVTAASALVGFVVLSDRSGLTVLVGAQIVGAAASAVPSALTLRRAADARAERRDLARTVRFGAPVAPQGLSAWALRLQDRLVIQAALGSSPTGVYAMANRLTAPLLLVNAAGVRALSSDLSQAGASEEGRSRRVAVPVMSFITVSAVTVVAVTGLINVGIDLVLTSKYADAATPAMLLVPAVALYGVYQVAALSTVLIEGRSLNILALIASAAVANLVLTIAFVQAWGIEGAAVATLLCSAGLAAGAFRVSPLARTWPRPTGSALTGLVAVVALVVAQATLQILAPTIPALLIGLLLTLAAAAAGVTSLDRYRLAQASPG